MCGSGPVECAACGHVHGVVGHTQQEEGWYEIIWGFGNEEGVPLRDLSTCATVENVAQFYQMSHNFWPECARPVAQNFDGMRPWCHFFYVLIFRI